MPKGQIAQWKDFMAKQKAMKQKARLKQKTKEDSKCCRQRLPTQCSICNNPRQGRRGCYLCNEAEETLQADERKLLDLALARSKKIRAGGRQQTLTQIIR